MKLQSLLLRLGLSSSEAEVYKSLLDLGPANISDIAKRTGLYRPQIYKLLSGLSAKRLIVLNKFGKRSVYAAENPRQLKSLINRLSDDLEQMDEELFEAYRNSKKRPVIKSFQGKDGIRRVFDEMMNNVKRGDIIYRYESPKDFKKNKQYYPRLYLTKSNDSRGSFVEKFVITNEKTQKTRRQRLERYSKAVPSNIPFEYDITQLIYLNRVVFIDYKREVANVIESTRYAEFQKQLFKLLFKSL